MTFTYVSFCPALPFLPKLKPADLLLPCGQSMDGKPMPLGASAGDDGML